MQLYLGAAAGWAAAAGAAGSPSATLSRLRVSQDLFLDHVEGTRGEGVRVFAEELSSGLEILAGPLFESPPVPRTELLLVQTEAGDSACEEADLG